MSLSVDASGICMIRSGAKWFEVEGTSICLGIRGQSGVSFYTASHLSAEEPTSGLPQRLANLAVTHDCEASGAFHAQVRVKGFRGDPACEARIQRQLEIRADHR